MELQRLKNGIYATAMDMYIYEQYEEFDFKTDDDAADGIRNGGFGSTT